MMARLMIEMIKKGLLVPVQPKPNLDRQYSNEKIGYKYRPVGSRTAKAKGVCE